MNQTKVYTENWTLFPAEKHSGQNNQCLTKKTKQGRNPSEKEGCKKWSPRRLNDQLESGP